MKPVWNFTHFGHLKLFRISDFVLRISCSLAPLRPFDLAQDMLCGSHLFSDFQICLPRSLSSFQEAQIQGAIDTHFLLHAVAAKPLGLIR